MNIKLNLKTICNFHRCKQCIGFVIHTYQLDDGDAIQEFGKYVSCNNFEVVFIEDVYKYISEKYNIDLSNIPKFNHFADTTFVGWEYNHSVLYKYMKDNFDIEFNITYITNYDTGE